jgi:PPOX class probable FMN-dependent enzyme
MYLRSIDELRVLYAAPKERALRKQLARLDVHCQRFIALSPYLVLASCNAAGGMDASPRGGDPGFVKVPDEGTLLLPDAPGNNRLDSFENIVANGQVGLLFMIPGVDETLRVNGTAVLSRADADLELCTDERRRPKLVVRVAVNQAYLHCAKALMRSRLWSAASRIERSVLPTLGKMINDQTGIETPVETQQEMARRYACDL